MFNRIKKNTLNSAVITEKCDNIKVTLFLLPLFLLITIFLFLYNADALCIDKYVQIQKSYFFYINSKLSLFPHIIYNLNQIGDALIFLSFLSILIVYAPKVWEALLSASIITVIFTRLLKNIFSVPRPAEVFNNHTFVIIGKRLPGFSSFPSGHSITVFTILTVLMFAFMPRKISFKILWCFLLVSIGFFIAFIRVGVGAHYPLDVTIGCIIGYTSALIGLFISKKYKIWSWIYNKKNYPFFIALFLVCCAIIINKIRVENLIIYYLSLISLIVSLYKIVHVYIKK